MMIDAVMYGMIPRKKIATLVIAPPEKRSRKPTTPPVLSALCCSCLIALEVDVRNRQVGTEPVDRDDADREEDLVAEVGHPEHVPQAGQHGGSTSSRRSEVSWGKGSRAGSASLSVGQRVATGRRTTVAPRCRDDLDPATRTLDGA